MDILGSLETDVKSTILSHSLNPAHMVLYFSWLYLAVPLSYGCCIYNKRR